MKFSVFADYMVSIRGKVAPSIWPSLPGECPARLKARQDSGRADGPLLFDDLINRLESAII